MFEKIELNKIDDIFKDVAGVEDDRTGCSIPDVYGRVVELGILLNNSLNRGEKYLPEKLLQWRGILTILALQDFLKLDIEIETIPLTNFANGLYAFNKAIMLTPKNGVIDEAGWNWDAYHIIKLRENSSKEYIDIAIFSPSTLIYPVADLNEIMPDLEEITWFDNKKFVNPVECLIIDQKQVVCHWLTEMINQLSFLANKLGVKNNGEPNTIDIIIKQLEKYEMALGNSGLKSFSLIPITNLGINSKVHDIINQTVKVRVYIDGQTFDYHEAFADKIQSMVGIGINNMNFFTHCLFEEGHKIEIGNLESDKSQEYAILPIGRKIVEQISEQQLAQLASNIKMEWFDEKRVAVKMNFSQLDSRNIDITKIMECADGEAREQNDIQIAIWPTVYYEDWKKYYLYFDRGAHNLEICNNRGEKKSRIGGFVYEYQKFPYKIEFEENDKEKKNYLGVILPNMGQCSPVGNRSAEVVVDFGTSSTICYAKIDGQEEEEIFFQQENSKLLIKKEEDYSVTKVAQNFIPLEIEREKMYSVYKAFDSNVVNKATPILEGIIYYAKKMEVVPESADAGKFLTDLKWMTDTNRSWYQAFLCQLCMQITLYLMRQQVGIISWKYAVPLSLEDKDIKLVGEAWGKIIEFLKELDPKVQHTLNTFTTESQAISNYFYNHRYVATTCQLLEEAGYIIVDIGGGSIDFSLWKANTDCSRMWETSVPVASRKLFSKIVLEDIENFKTLFAENQEEEKLKRNQLAEIQKLNVNGQKEIGIAFLEKFIEDNCNEIQGYMSKQVNDKRGTWITHFRKKLYLGAAMILYCTGQMVGEKIQYGQFLICEGKTFYVVLAGNGSKLFDWLFDECWDNIDGAEKEKFVQIFLAGVRSRQDGVDFDVQIVKSPQPKKEVALGLLFKNSQIETEKFIKGEFTEQEIINWKDSFLNVYRECFGENSYGSSCAWDNFASRVARMDKDSCNIMMQDVLEQL